MNCLIYSDPHWCQNSSIVRTRGVKYSTRLENLIESLNWVEHLAWNTNCECIICCGDFFDSSSLNAEEISALQEICWAPVSHLFLTGNHETNVSSLDYSTTDLFKLCPNSCVVSSPQQYFIDNTSVEFCFLPYVLEQNRKPIVEYFGKPTCSRVIFSHNDIKNVQYGSFLSSEGFEVSDIESNSDLCFNGHIHHCCNVTSKIVNVGNLTGQNFTEDATKYSHCAIVLNTETLEYKFYENPYALKFYKIDATCCFDEIDLRNKLSVLQHNAVATIQVDDVFLQDARQLLEELKKDHIQEYKLLVRHQIKSSELPSVAVNSVDHLKQFESYINSTLENSVVVQEELQHILR